MSKKGRGCPNSGSHASNPFDSDSDSDTRGPATPPRYSSEHTNKTFPNNPDGKNSTRSPFNDAGTGSRIQSSSNGSSNASRIRTRGVKFASQVKEKVASVCETSSRRAGRSKEAGSSQSQKSTTKNVEEEGKQRDELFRSYGEEEDSDSSSQFKYSRAARDRYKDGFRKDGGLENQSVQELENYAVYKSEETTDAVNACLKIAEDIRDDGTRTVIMLHHQGEQITRTHMEAAGVDQELSRGEKLLGSLGGIFSKTWKPKKTRQISGPVITKSDSFKRRAAHMEQRERLGIAPAARGKSGTRQYPTSTTAQEKIEVEKEKQDDALNDLSNLLGELKVMAFDMGSEIERQNNAMDNLYDDVDELNSRVKGATVRGRRLLGK